MTTRVELIITALQQRIAELELDKAILRAELTEIRGQVVQEEASDSTAEDSN
jgi:hypothetical protein